jgi:predicted nucleotidyltransferase
MDAAVVRQVDQRLASVEQEHGVRVVWAVESGSRAWGFPSPDSDYDCRFVYVRPSARYLDPWLPRDVVETPLDAVLDVNGWDLRKALQLMVRGNATVVEWLRSPIVYRGVERVRDQLLRLAQEVAEPELLRRHYAHLGRLQWERLGLSDPAEEVRLKGLLYALRPAAALHWYRVHPDAPLPPMRLQDLLAQAPPAADVVQAVHDLVARKASAREVGTGRVPPAVRQFVLAELYADDLSGGGSRRLPVADARRLAGETFRAVLADGGHPAEPSDGPRPAPRGYGSGGTAERSFG